VESPLFRGEELLSPSQKETLLLLRCGKRWLSFSVPLVGEKKGYTEGFKKRVYRIHLHQKKKLFSIIEAERKRAFDHHLREEVRPFACGRKNAFDPIVGRRGGGCF